MESVELSAGCAVSAFIGWRGGKGSTDGDQGGASGRGKSDCISDVGGIGGRLAVDFFGAARVGTFARVVFFAASFDGVTFGGTTSDGAVDLVALDFATRLLAAFLGAAVLVLTADAVSTSPGSTDLRGSAVSRFLAGFFAGSTVASADAVAATGGGANGSSPVMASVVTSSLRIAPVSCGGLVGLAMVQV